MIPLVKDFILLVDMISAVLKKKNIDMVMHWWKEHLAFEFDYFSFLSSSESSNKGFKDVRTFFVPKNFHYIQLRIFTGTCINYILCINSNKIGISVDRFNDFYTRSQLLTGTECEKLSLAFKRRITKGISYSFDTNLLATDPWIRPW